jgi:hypothetical protein
MFKVIIAGGRDFNNYSLLEAKCRALLLTNYKPSDLEIVSGKANGADSLGERFAKDYNIKVAEFPADWDTHKKAAGPIRNTEMAEYANALIAFHDGESRGTKHMIDTAKKKGLAVRVVYY